MEIQSLINDHLSVEMPEIFDKHQIYTILDAIKNRKSRDDVVGEWIKARDTLLVYMCYTMALRPKEVCMIKLGDIDLKEGLVKINPMSNKTRRGRLLPIPSQLIPHLKSYLSFPKIQFWKFSEYLFPSLKCEHISRDRFTEIFRNILKDAGIYKEPTRGKHGHFSAYSLRHTKATELYEKTSDPFMVANLLGHKTLESTKVYIHMAEIKKGYLNKMKNCLSAS